ncbi:hypothetical protein N9H17_05720 [Schleiferiaceae bacterium]|jgi:hypothetical protein|nr:hypothetical protein [Schleiferiaceae bacterium]
MKSKLFLIVTLAALATGVSAQSRWGLRTGLNFDMAGIGLNDALSTSQSIFEGAATDDGYHLGFFGRQFIGDQFYIGASALYVKNSKFLSGNDGTVLIYESFDHNLLQFESSAGLRLLKFARAEAGVHYQHYLADNTFTSTFAPSSAGYNVGLGVDLWKLGIDLVYYSNFQNHTGDWNGIPLSYNRAQLLLSLSAKL